MNAIILAGGLGTRVAELAPVPKPLLPLAGRTVLEHIIEELRRHRIRQIALVQGGRERGLSDAVDVVVWQPEPRGPGDAIRCAVRDTRGWTGPVVVVCADTVFRVDELPTYDCVLVADAPRDDDWRRWCYVTSDALGYVTGFVDKPDVFRPPTRDVNIGVYVFSDVERLRVMLSRVEVREISEVLELYGTSQMVVERVQEWLDTGTPASFMRARRRRFISRAFNSLDVSRGYVVKRSTDVVKLRREFEWYERAAVRGLAGHIPPDVHWDEDAGVLSMRYVPYNTLSDYFLFDQRTPVVRWQDLITRIVDVVCESNTSLHPGFLNYLALDALLLLKTDERVAEARNDLLTDRWRRYRPIVERFVSDVKNLRPCLLHGDLNLTNILVNPDFDDFVVVDPRGYPDAADVRYDAGKLWHSLMGYDHIVNDLPYELTTYQRAVVEGVRNVSPYAEDLPLIAGTLFLSMIPLHADRPDRQLRFIERADACFREAGA